MMVFPSSLNQEMIIDFETYINEDDEFFDSEGEESLSEVSLERKEDDFSETNGPKESNQSFMAL